MRPLQRRVYVLAVVVLALLTPLSARGSLAAPIVGGDLPGGSVFHGNPARTSSYAATYRRPATQVSRAAVSRHVDRAGSKRHPHAALESGCPANWQCQDIGSPPTPGSSSFDGTTWTVTGSGGFGGSGDNLQFDDQTYIGAGTTSVSAHVTSMRLPYAGDAAGVMIRDGVGPAANFYAAQVDASGNVSVIYRNVPGAAGSPTTPATVAHYIQIHRDGFSYTTYTSPTGADGTWTPVPGSTVGVDIQSSYAGIFVTAGITTTNTATFDGVSTSGGGTQVTSCADGWTCRDIGGPPSPGSQDSTNDGTAWVLTGTGCGLIYCPGDGQPDQFRYAYQTFAPGGSMVARITYQTGSNSSLAETGLMFRQSADGRAKYDGIFVQGSTSGGNHIVVSTPGGSCDGQVSGLPAYVSLTWNGGNSFSAEAAPDAPSLDQAQWHVIPCPFSGPVLFSGAILGGLVNSIEEINAPGVGSFADVHTSGQIGPTADELYSPTEHQTACPCAQPVDGATGFFWHTFSDMSIPGRGVPLSLTHTYRSLLAGQDSPLGFGWTDSYNMFLSTTSDGSVSVHEEGGTAVPLQPNGSGGYQAPSRVMATLTTNPDGTLTFTRIHGGDQYVFSAPTPTAAGQLLREVDRNGYATTLSYANGQLTRVTDPAGRTLSVQYNPANRIDQISDSSGRTETFSYDSSGNLTDVTDTRQGTWHFTYDPNHLLLTMEDPRQYAANGPLSTGPVTSNVYDAQGRVTQQTDPMQRPISFVYSMTSDGLHQTQITDPRGTVTIERYQDNELQTLI